MSPFQIKICGVTCVEDAVFAVRVGADAIGLNFYEKSSRYVSPPVASKTDFNQDPKKHDAAQIVDAIRRCTDSPNTRSANNRSVKVVGVFVNLEVRRVVEIASQLGLDGIQLHGDEPPADAREIRELLEPLERRKPILIIRAVRTNPRGQKQSDPTLEIARIMAEIDQWAKSGVDAVLLDAAVAGEFGGTGESVDWTSVPKIQSAVPIILAGGLTAQNVSDAIGCSQTQAVDVASGVESSPGEKDDLLVRQFVESAKSSLASPASPAS